MRVHQRFFRAIQLTEGSFHILCCHKPAKCAQSGSRRLLQMKQAGSTARFYDEVLLCRRPQKGLEAHGGWQGQMGPQRWNIGRQDKTRCKSRSKVGTNLWRRPRDCAPCWIALQSRPVQPNGWGIPSLQGHVGRLLAEFDENEEVSNAMEGHYFPRYHGDQLPQCRTALLVGLADRWDTLINCFRLGLAPKAQETHLVYAVLQMAFCSASMEIHLNSSFGSEAELDDALYDFLIPDSAQLQRLPQLTLSTPYWPHNR